MRSNTLGWLLLAPTLLILVLFGVVPFLYVIWVSFHQWNPFGANPDMIPNGADNYRQLVFDAGFLASLGVTALFVLFAVASELVLGYALAQALMRDFPGKAVFRTIHTLPLIMAPIIVGSIWKLMTTPSIGIIPSLLNSWFGYDMNIGQSASAAFVVTVIMDIWHWTPLVTLIAALVSLPADPFEQAQIDGRRSSGRPSRGAGSGRTLLHQPTRANWFALREHSDGGPRLAHGAHNGAETVASSVRNAAHGRHPRGRSHVRNA